MAPRNFVQTQVFVGPLWEPDGSACAWDWSRTQDLDLAGVQGKLAAILYGGSVACTYTGITLPPKGGMWLGPDGAGQGWEYVAYDWAGGGSASGLRREATSIYEHNGVHGGNAVVQLWAQLVGDDGKIHIVRETNDMLCATKWSAEISGVAASRAFLRRHHAVLVRQRESHLLPWTSLLLGWLDEYSVDDDFSKVAKWKIRVVSSAGMLEKMAAPPLRSGDLDLCKYGKIIVQDVQLASIHKEWNSGDFVAASPDVSAKAAIDGDDNSAWIPERVLGFYDDTVPFAASDELEWGEVFILNANLGIPPGLGKGFRWIQLASIQQPLKDCIFCNKNGELGGLIEIGGRAGTGGRIFVVENLNMFSAHNPLADPTRIKEVGAAFFDALDMDNDGIAIWNGGDAWQPTNWRGKALKWRNPNIPNLPDFVIRRSDSQEPDADAAPLMAGAYLPTPSNGEIWAWRRRAGVPVGTGWYDVGGPDTAGYYPGSTQPSPFFLVQLPTMGLALKGDVTAGYTGLIECWDGKTTHTNGLPASGVIQIGSEQLRYTFKTKTALNVVERGYGPTDPAAHAAGDSVLVVDGSQATDAFQVREIRWRRREGKAHPFHFKIYVSGMPVQPRPPVADDEDPNHEFALDYEKLVDETWYPASVYTKNLQLQPRRVSWILFQISLMSVQPSRARIDSLEAILEPALLDPDCWLPDGATLADALVKLLDNAGMPSGAVTIEQPLPFTDAFKIMTAHSTAWAVLTDLADYTGCYVYVDLLSQITIGTNSIWHPELTVYPNRTWDRSNLATVQFIGERSSPTAQVQMQRMNADGSLAETLTYPALMDAVGDVQKVKDSIYPSHDAAMNALQRRYLIAKYPYTVGFQTALGQDDLAPGEVNSVSWALGDSDPTGSATAVRTGIVRDVEHTIEGLAWKTAARLVLYREAY